MSNALVLKSWRRTVLVLSVTLLVLTLVAAQARTTLASSAEEAAQFVRDFSSEAIAVLSDSEVSQAQQDQQFRRLLNAGFELEVIGKFVLGRHWRRASDEERAEFQKVFGDYLIAGYSRQLSAYSGEQLKVGPGQPQGDRGALVSSRIIRPDAEDIRVDWRLRRTGEEWKIIDVIVEGVSMATTYRSEFSAVIGSSGGKVAGLIEVLRSKTASQEMRAAAALGDAS
jgi:phospholipid transport system substrate-binding protein